MTAQVWTVFAVLVATVGLFVVDVLRLDLVALLSLLSLLLTGVLTVSEGLAGFSDPLVLIIAGLFVVGGGLFRTGVADLLGGLLARIGGKRPGRLVVTIMVSVALLSAFLSSTGTVAILLPVVVRLAEGAKLSPSKLLIPLALASLLGGLLTLIGTPPNLVVSQQLVARGQEPFGFFAFAPIGLVLVVVGVAFMACLGWRMLPDRSVPREQTDEPDFSELAVAYDLPGNLWWLHVDVGSPLLSTTLGESQMRSRYGVSVLEARRGDVSMRETSLAVGPDYRFVAGDRLLVHANPRRVRKLCEQERLSLMPAADAQSLIVPGSVAIAEVLLTPRSQLVGRTLSEASFHDVHDLTVVAVLRRGRPLKSDLATTYLKFGDALLVQGAPKRIAALGGSRRDLVVVGVPAPEGSGIQWRGVVAIAVMVSMLVVMTLGILPTATTVLCAASAMVLLRCLDMEEAYRAISWESLVLIAAMLPMATALQKTGGIGIVVDGLTSTLGRFGPRSLMAGLFLLTALFSQFVSNTATTVLVAPVALEAAARLGVAPRPLLMSVAIAASTSFATPIASPVNTLIMTPGGYRFSDYAKVGLPLQLLLLLLSLGLVPMVFPFAP